MVTSTLKLFMVVNLKLKYLTSLYLFFSSLWRNVHGHLTLNHHQSDVVLFQGLCLCSCHTCVTALSNVQCTVKTKLHKIHLQIDNILLRGLY